MMGTLVVKRLIIALDVELKDYVDALYLEALG